jgi:hypothetical protein
MAPARWSYRHCSILGIRRRVPGRCIADVESAVLIEPLLQDAVARQRVRPGQLTRHADRGVPAQAGLIAVPLAGPAVSRAHDRLHAADDNPFPGRRFKTPKVSVARSMAASTIAGRRRVPVAIPWDAAPARL